MCIQCCGRYGSCFHSSVETAIGYFLFYHDLSKLLIHRTVGSCIRISDLRFTRVFVMIQFVESLFICLCCEYLLCQFAQKHLIFVTKSCMRVGSGEALREYGAAYLSSSLWKMSIPQLSPDNLAIRGVGAGGTLYLLKSLPTPSEMIATLNSLRSTVLGIGPVLTPTRRHLFSTLCFLHHLCVPRLRPSEYLILLRDESRTKLIRSPADRHRHLPR